MLAVARPVNLAFGLSSNEMDASHHMASFMEVDLRTCQPNTLVDRINAVPALKTSAGKKQFAIFLSFTPVSSGLSFAFYVPFFVFLIIPYASVACPFRLDLDLFQHQRS